METNVTTAAPTQAVATWQQMPLPERKRAFETLLVSSRTELEEILPGQVKFDYFKRSVLMVLHKNPKLLECTRISLLSSIMTCMQLGLMPDSIFGEAHLIPFKRNLAKKNQPKNEIMEAQVLVGYKGLKKLARNTGIVQLIYDEPVFKGDHFIQDLGLNKTLEHRRPEDESERKYDDPVWVYENLTHAYAVVHFKDGSKDFKVFTKAQIEARRKRSKNQVEWINNKPVVAEKPIGVWLTDYIAMSGKTVVRALCNQMEQSTETQVLHRALTLDNTGELLNQSQKNNAILNEHPNLLAQVADEYNEEQDMDDNFSEAEVIEENEKIAGQVDKGNVSANATLKKLGAEKVDKLRVDEPGGASAPGEGF
jgi:recombination protein RecT